MTTNPNREIGCTSGTKPTTTRLLFRVIARLIVPIAMLALGIYVERSNRGLIHNSSSISAELISAPSKQLQFRVSDVGASSASDHYQVDYRFDVDGQTYTGHATLTSVPTGDRMLVYYEIGNPANNRAELPSNSEGAIWICLALSLGIAVSLFPWR